MDFLLRFIEDSAQDIRFAARSLLKTPGFTAVAVVSCSWFMAKADPMVALRNE